MIDVKGKISLALAEPDQVQLPTTPGLYAIVNIETRRTYIGRGADVRNRQQHHVYLLRKGDHPNAEMQGDWRRFGEGAFRFVHLGGIAENSAPDEQERHCIQQALDNCYNMISRREPMAVTDRVAELREQRKRLGIKRRELYATEAEWELLKALADELQRKRDSTAA